MRKTVIAQAAYSLNVFPDLATDNVAGRLEEPCEKVLNQLFDSYIERIEPSLNEKTKSKVLAQIERVRKSALKKFNKFIDSYVIDITGISPKGFSNVG